MSCPGTPRPGPKKREGKHSMRKWLTMTLILTLLLSLTSVSAASEPSTVTLDVVFKAGTLPADATATVEAMGATVVSTAPSIGFMTVTGPASLITKLNSHKEILAASPQIEVQLNPAQMIQADVADANPGAADLYQLYGWDIDQVTMDGASWELGTGSHNTVVGIIDSGASLAHPDLAANLLGGRNYVPDGPGGTVDPNDIDDRRGHGSHVAGSIAGNGRILGVAPDMGFRAYRVFGASGGSPSDRIVQAIIDAVNDGVDVINMSLGGFDAVAGYTWTDPATGEVYKYKDVASFVGYKRAVQYAVNHGVVVVAAAGNDATNISNPPEMTALLNFEYGPLGYEFWGASHETPGTLPGVITVSATGPDMSLASYSNYGPGAIDLSAPGGDFQRYPAPGWFLDMCVSSYTGTGYAFSAGTSMATPKVAAVAALMIDQAKANGETLSPAQVVTKLQQSSVDMGKKGYDPAYGYGFLNAYYALGGN